MKLRPVARPIPLEVPAIIAKRATGGAGWRGADEYASGKDGAELLSTSLEGKTPRERSREIARLLAGSRLKRHCDHWSLSVDPRLGKLSDDQWRQAAEVFLKRMTYEGCAYTLTRHVDTKVDHCHLLILRRRGDGSTVSDSNDFKRGHAAAVAAAESLGLKPLPPRPDSVAKPAPTDAQVGAAKRARARGTRVQNHHAVAAAFDAVVARSTSLDELHERATEVGLDVFVVRKSGGTIQGLNVKATGAIEWQKASGLRKDGSLSWGKVEARLAQNAALRARAQAAADEANTAARAQAEARVAARLARQRDPEIPTNRALLPESIATTKENLVSDQADPLNFLSSPPAPRPDGQPLDDVGLAPATGSPTEQVAKEEEDDHARRERLELEAAEIELDNSFRKKTFDELLDLKNHRIEPVLITGAQLEALLNLVMRVLTLGLFRGTNHFAQELSAKEALSARAQAEIQRRKKSPASVAERGRVLTAFENAARARSLELNSRAVKRALALSRPDPIAQAAAAKALRRGLEKQFDQRQTEAGLQTVAVRRVAVVAAKGEVLAAKKAAAEGTERVGMFGVKASKGQLQALVAASAARLTAARTRREAALLALSEYLDQVEQWAEQRELAEAQAAAAQMKAEAQERESLALELGVGQPGGLSPARRQLDAQALQERISGVVREAAEGAGGADVERAAARDEWLKLMRKGG